MARLSDRQRVFTLNISKLIEFSYSIGIELTFGEAYRTFSQQLLHYFGYTVGRDGDGGLELIKIKRKSWTIFSKHLDRLAVDFNFFIDGELTYDAPELDQLGRYWESLDENNKWGGFWRKRDAPHFQMK